MTPIWAAFIVGGVLGVFIAAVGISACMLSSQISRDEERVADNEVARRLLERGL